MPSCFIVRRFDIVVTNLYEYMCASNYFSMKRFDAVIAKIKKVQFFDSQCIIENT